VNAPQLARLLYAASIFDLDSFRTKVFPAWKLDFSKINSSSREATFNVYNFSKHDLRAIPPAEMTEDFLIAAASLPMWFPPVRIAGDTYRIAANNAALKRGKPGDFGRPITVREINAEVPLHYLLNFNRDRAAEAVNRGVEAARNWCDEAAISRRLGFGAIEQQAGFEQGRRERASLALKLEVHVADLDRFLDLPEHTAELKGSVECEKLGESRSIEHGILHLLVDRGDPAQKQITYEVIFQDGNGETITLIATKNLTGQSEEHAAQEPIAVLATLSLRADQGSKDQAAVIAMGVLKSGVLDAIELLASIHVDAPTVAARGHALTRFGAFFGRLWDVYARHLLPVAPF
jgi:hypothetical protein